MAISQVQIANMALSHVGSKSTITTLAEVSAEARQCLLWYEFALRQSLAGFDWSFARKRFTLTPAGDAPPMNWGYRYQYPADCVAFRRITNPSGTKDDAVPFEIETDSNGIRTILTNMDAAEGQYTFYLDDPTRYTPLFVELLSRALAYHIGWPLTKTRAVVQDQYNAYHQILNTAPAADANERVGEPPRDAEWIRGRTFQYPVPPFSRVQ